jgi:hypothetical protein
METGTTAIVMQHPPPCGLGRPPLFRPKADSWFVIPSRRTTGALHSPLDLPVASDPVALPNLPAQHLPNRRQW